MDTDATVATRNPIESLSLLSLGLGFDSDRSLVCDVGAGSSGGFLVLPINRIGVFRARLCYMGRVDINGRMSGARADMGCDCAHSVLWDGTSVAIIAGVAAEEN